MSETVNQQHLSSSHSYPMHMGIREGEVEHDHGGVPIGAIVINARYAQSFRKELDKAIIQQQIIASQSSNPVRFRGVERLPNYSTTASTTNLIMFHLPPTAAEILDDGHPELLTFLKNHGGEYLPGVRRRRKPSKISNDCSNHNCAHRDKRTKENNARFHRDNDDAFAGRVNQKRIRSSKQPNSSSLFTFVELFGGIGGFRIGLEPLGGQCVFYSELCQSTVDIYQSYFGDFDVDDDNDGDDDTSSSLAIVGDILDVHASDMPENFDILTAGFPCQPFSQRAGNQRKGFADEKDNHHRGQLYRELVRILNAKQPKAFLFENVVGLLIMEGGYREQDPKKKNDTTTFVIGHVFQVILKAFRQCGYNVDWKVVNSRHFLPQYRERVYIVGTRIDLKCPSLDWESLFDREGLSTVTATTTVRSILEPKESPSVKESELTRAQWCKVQSMHLNKHNRTANQTGSINIHDKAPTLISSYHRVGSYSTKFIFEEADGTVRNSDRSDNDGRINGSNNQLRPRFLTPRECCRLMGFPDTFPVPCIDNGDTEQVVAQFYKGIGNAVTPPVITAIGKALLSTLQIGNNNNINI